MGRFFVDAVVLDEVHTERRTGPANDTIKEQLGKIVLFSLFSLFLVCSVTFRLLFNFSKLCLQFL